MWISSMLFIVQISSLEAHTYHKFFYKEELGEYFGVDNHHQVPKYHTSTVDGIHNERRDVNDTPLPLTLSITLPATTLTFNVSLDYSFIANTYITQHVGQTNITTNRFGDVGDFSRGKIQDDENSFVALHHRADGIAGIVRTSSNMYFINPLPIRLQKEHSDHIIYSVMDLYDEHPLKYLFNTNTTKKKKKKKKERVRRHVSEQTTPTKKTMELFIAADYTMYEYYGSNLLSYMLAVTNILSALFMDHTLESTLDIVVVGTQIFTTDQFHAQDMDDLLTKFHQWCTTSGINPQSDTTPSHFDNAVLWTRNGCHGGCGVEGLAYFGPICGFFGQAVGKDRGLMSALTIAHEIAHMLNSEHDGDDSCPDGMNIMTTSGTEGGVDSLEWSTCSSAIIKEALTRPKAECFDDEPTGRITNSSFLLYGTIYNASVQCQFIYGDMYGDCIPLMNRCDQLFCRENGSMECNTQFRPPAHGTKCGEYEWCIYGVCVPNGEKPPPPINGVWSEWGEYSECSHSCGIGVQWRVRHCNNPEPQNNGKFCNSDARNWGPEKGHFRTCNTKECEGKKRDYVEDGNNECHKYGEELKYCALCPRHLCELICGTAENLGRLYGKAIDGTMCSLDDHKGICINGVCHELDCTKSIDTQHSVDRCGLCAGNGTTCSNEVGHNETIFEENGEFQIITIPIGASDVSVKESGNSFTFLSFKVGQSLELAYNVPCYPKLLYIAGVEIRYIVASIYEADEIKIAGTLHTEIHIYLVNVYRQPSSGVHWSMKNTKQSPLPDVIWQYGLWSECPMSCAQGRQHRHVHCTRKDDGTSVNIAACPTTGKPESDQLCNVEPCPALWRITKWSHCTKSCGSGEQTRSIFCASLVEENRYENVEDSACHLTKPTGTFQKCNQRSCSAEWVIKTNFTKCSTTCGEGTKTRDVKCHRIDKDGEESNVNKLECHRMYKPKSIEVCNDDLPCPKWDVKYGTCSVTCGGGLKVAKMSCVTLPEFIVDDSHCVNEVKPDMLPYNPENCNGGLCVGHQWHKNESACSVTCGEGQSTILVECRDIAEKTLLDDSFCDPKSKPVTTKVCQRGLCIDYRWKTIKEECSTSCDKGLISHIPKCWERIEDIFVDNNLCNITTKPMVTFDDCNLRSCPSYDWVLKYGDCSKTCSEGFEEATVVCQQQADRKYVEDANCADRQMIEISTRTCNLGDCPVVASYYWNVKDLGCNVKCGKGHHTYVLVCYGVSEDDMTETEVKNEKCADKPEPDINIMSCKLSDCILQYEWLVTHGHCATGCGRADFHLVEMQCIESNTEVVNNYSYCEGAPVPQVPTCERRECDTVTAESINFYPIGCYWDNIEERRVPYYLESFRETIDWYDTLDTIVRCLVIAYAGKFPFFSIQFHGECWVGYNDIQDTYFKDGRADNCYQGTGGSNSNYIYHIGTPLDQISLPIIIRLGCFTDDGEAKITLGEERYNEIISEDEDVMQKLIEWDEERIENVLQVCATEAYKGSHLFFGGNTMGTCLTKTMAEKTIELDRFDMSCAASLGKHNQYYIYKFYENNNVT